MYTLNTFVVHAKQVRRRSPRRSSVVDQHLVPLLFMLHTRASHRLVAFLNDFFRYSIHQSCCDSLRWTRLLCALAPWIEVRLRGILLRPRWDKGATCRCFPACPAEIQGGEEAPRYQCVHSGAHSAVHVGSDAEAHAAAQLWTNT